MQSESISQDPPRLGATSTGIDSHERLDTSDPKFISSLPEPLRGFAVLAFPPDDDSFANDVVAASHEDVTDGTNKYVKQDEGVKEDATFRLDQLEINVRSHLLQLAENIISTSEGTVEFQDSLDALLVFARDVTLLCLHVVDYAAENSKVGNNVEDQDGGSREKKAPKSYQDLPSSFKKLPCLLLEDAFTSLPLTHVQRLWSGYPSKKSKIASNGKFSDGKTSNGVNSNKSKNLCISRHLLSYITKPQIFTQGSKFCFLRICNTLLKQLSNRDVDSEFAGSIMMALARVFPISERSAVNVLGSFNVENATVFEGKEEFQQGWRVRHSKENKGGSEDGDETGKIVNTMVPSLGFDFYSTFWGLQKVFTDPQGTILPSRGKLSNPEALTKFNSFTTDVRTVLAALEGTPTTSTSKTKKLSSDVSAGSASDITDIHHHKYLTSSQLLHLQLRDSDIRIHFLTQLTIVLSYLSSPSATLPTSETSDTTASNDKATPTASSVVTKQIIELEKRTQQLLRQTPPSGESHWKTLQWILKERESIWRNWKKNKCMPAMDRSGDNNKDGIERMRMVLSGMKRKSPDSSSAGNDAFIKSNHTIGIETDLPKITAKMTESIPSLSDFLHPYIEALDPENGIEDTYHPRNDKVYCWRALRMLARDQTGKGQLHRFGKLRRRDGDFENIVRKIWSEEREVKIPGSMAEEEHYDPSDTEDEAVKKEEGTDDAEMDEPSVGSPVLDDDDGDDGEVLDETLEKERAAAAEEKKKEFAKALMDLDEMSGASMEPENVKGAAGLDGNEQVDNGVDVKNGSTSHAGDKKSESSIQKSNVSLAERNDDIPPKGPASTKDEGKNSESSMKKPDVSSAEKKDHKISVQPHVTKDNDEGKGKKNDQPVLINDSNCNQDEKEITSEASVKRNAEEPKELKEPMSNPAEPNVDDQHSGKNVTASSSTKANPAEHSTKNDISSSKPTRADSKKVVKDEKTCTVSVIDTDTKRSTTLPPATKDEKTSTTPKPVDAKGSANAPTAMPPSKDNKNTTLDTNGKTTPPEKNHTNPPTQTQAKLQSGAKFEPPPKAQQSNQGQSQSQQHTHRTSGSQSREEPSKGRTDSGSNARGGGGGARSSYRGGSGGSGEGNDGRPSHESHGIGSGRGDGDQGNRSGGGVGGKVNGDRDGHGHRGGGGGGGGGRGDRRGSDDHRRGQSNNPHNVNRGGQDNNPKGHNANEGGGGGGGGRRGKRSHSPDHKGGGDRGDSRGTMSNRGGRDWGSQQNRGGRGPGGGGQNRRDDRGSNRRGRR
ncbi:hypothetical protein ACHAXS_013097 [Conticribra weissflogii]